MDEVLKTLRERCKRTVLRKIETGEVTYDRVKKIFYLKDTEQEYKLDKKEEGDKESEDEEK